VLFRSIDDKVRLRAEDLYVKDGKTQEKVAEILSVARKTVGRWYAKGNWEEKRRARFRDSSKPTLDKLKAQREALLATFSGDPVADASATSQIAILSNWIARLEDHDRAVQPVLDVMDRFANFVAATCSDADKPIISAATSAFFVAVKNQQA